MGFSVPRAEAAKFAQVWNKGGIAVPLQDIHIDFACDFANIVIKNFIEMVAANAQQAKAKVQTLIVSSPNEVVVSEKKLIIEGH